jgi:hypothetical protein
VALEYLAGLGDPVALEDTEGRSVDREEDREEGGREVDNMDTTWILL